MMNLPFTLKPDQANALHAVHHFLQDPAADVFVLRGSAGTGKTTLIPALLNTAIGLGIRIAMLSPTGRAARIMQTKVVNAFSANTDAVLPALTLHKFLYCLRRMHCELW
jgi:exodeoxyribonuclease-5